MKRISWKIDPSEFTDLWRQCDAYLTPLVEAGVLDRVEISKATDQCMTVMTVEWRVAC